MANHPMDANADLGRPDRVLREGESMTRQHLQTLIDYIRQHGCQARTDAAGTLFVLDEYIDSDGKPGAEWTQLTATLHSVRLWLGY